MSDLTIGYPTYLIKKQWITKVENRIVPIDDEYVEHFQKNHNATQMEHILFGYKIPYLPSLTNSPHLSGGSDRERVHELLTRQVGFIRALWKWKNTSFSLRYLWTPEEGKVNISFLISSYAPIGLGEQLGQKISDDIQSQLRMLEYPIEQMSTLDVLSKALNPIPNPAIIEVRQKQDMVKMRQGDAYVVYPYQASTFSTWLNVFRFLTMQKQSCGLSIFIEPTQLQDNEIAYFSAAAQYADSQRSQNVQLSTGNYQVNDPIAGIVANLYVDYIKRLQNPFVTTVQIFSPDKFLSLNIAQLVLAEVSESHSIEQTENTEKDLCGAELSIPQGSDEKSAVRTFTKLQFSIWGETAAREHQIRLRFLTDARTASSIFRFPIPLRDGVPGIKTKDSSLTSNKNPRKGDRGKNNIERIIAVLTIIISLLTFLFGDEIIQKIMLYREQLPTPPSSQPVTLPTITTLPTPILLGKIIKETSFSLEESQACEGLSYDLNKYWGYEKGFEKFYISAEKNGYVALCYGTTSFKPIGGIQVDAQVSNSRAAYIGYGVIMGWKDEPRNYCSFSIHKDGTGSLAKFVEVVDGKYKSTSFPINNIGLNGNSHTILMVINNDGNVTGYLDGHYVADDHFSSCDNGKIGLIGYGQGDEKILFDNFELRNFIP